MKHIDIINRININECKYMLADFPLYHEAVCRKMKNSHNTMTIVALSTLSTSIRWAAHDNSHCIHLDYCEPRMPYCVVYNCLSLVYGSFNTFRDPLSLRLPSSKPFIPYDHS